MAATKATTNRLAELDRIRQRFAALDREVHETERAPLPPAGIEARADAIVAALADQALSHPIGALMLSPERAGAVPGVRSLVDTLGHGRADHGRPIPAGALLAAVAPDNLRSWLVAVAQAEAEGWPPPLSDDERRQRLKLLADERRDLERDEVAACWLLEDQGQPAPWRAEMDVALVLGLVED